MLNNVQTDAGLSLVSLMYICPVSASRATVPLSKNASPLTRPRTHVHVHQIGETCRPALVVIHILDDSWLGIAVKPGYWFDDWATQNLQPPLSPWHLPRQLP